MVAMIGQTITIVNQSGKVVKTSKTLVNVFKEAKSAYDERKAELKASRVDKAETKAKVKKAQKQLAGLRLGDHSDDDASSMRSRSRRGSDDSGHRVHRRPVPTRTSERPPFERGVSDSFYANDAPSRPSRPSPLRFDSNGSLRSPNPRQGELVRRHTSTPLSPTYDDDALSYAAPSHARSHSLDSIDMDLAYGELPPPLPARNYDTEVAIRSQMSKLQQLLDEANCVQHSVTTMIANLQKDPDALAAVALTLAEISNLATKLAPGALMSMKGAFPAILALLASPEFMIAAGVGIGVTVIAFGGYKIVKKIQAKRALSSGRLLEGADEEPESPMSEMDELRELNHVERWRRGIVFDDDEVSATGTSVEGEFITPRATKTLIEEGKLSEADLKSEKKRRKKSSKTAKEEGSEASSRKSKSKSGKELIVKEKKKKEPSGLKMLFMSHA